MDEDIVHAGRNTRNNMNKATVAEAAVGSPPFYFLASGKLCFMPLRWNEKVVSVHEK